MSLNARALVWLDFLADHGMSALLPKADMCSATWYVRFVPKADILIRTWLAPKTAWSRRLSSLNLIGCGGKQLIVICVTFGSGPQDAFSEINLNSRRRILDRNPCHDIFKRFSHVSDELRCELRHSSTHSRW